MANPSQNSINYYREREQHEICLALKASSQAIRNIHLEMAGCYRVMVEKLEEALGTERDPYRSSAKPSARVQQGSQPSKRVENGHSAVRAGRQEIA